MKLHNPTAAIFLPDGQSHPITHLGIGAHQDDLEFMALPGIVAGYAARGFGGVTCTDGAGSPRAGRYAQFTDDQMRAERRREQNEAARLGRYGVMMQLDYPSAAVKDPRNESFGADLRAILAATRPRVVYTHHPADKHDTHVAVAVATIRAVRALPAADRPEQVLGCEGWRGLDWLPDAEKVVLAVTGHEELAAQLNACFQTQIAGGKRYDLAVLGRRRANATFLESHATDRAEQVCYAMDLTPLARAPDLDIVEYVTGFVRRLENDVRRRLTPWK
jgi:LmbE family N-acetylglucosaminyl deacetylase